MRNFQRCMLWIIGLNVAGVLAGAVYALVPNVHPLRWVQNLYAFAAGAGPGDIVLLCTFTAMIAAWLLTMSHIVSLD